MSYSDSHTHCILHVEDVTKETDDGKAYENDKAKTAVIEFVMDYMRNAGERTGENPGLCLRAGDNNIYVWFWDVTYAAYPAEMMRLIAEQFPVTKVILSAYRQGESSYTVTAWNCKVKVQDSGDIGPLSPADMNRWPVEEAE
jgi:hypothetical protein